MGADQEVVNNPQAEQAESIDLSDSYLNPQQPDPVAKEVAEDPFADLSSPTGQDKSLYREALRPDSYSVDLNPAEEQEASHSPTAVEEREKEVVAQTEEQLKAVPEEEVINEQEARELPLEIEEKKRPGLFRRALRTAVGAAEKVGGAVVNLLPERWREPLRRFWRGWKRLALGLYTAATTPESEEESSYTQEPSISEADLYEPRAHRVDMYQSQNQAEELEIPLKRLMEISGETKGWAEGYNEALQAFAKGVEREDREEEKAEEDIEEARDNLKETVERVAFNVVGDSQEQVIAEQVLDNYQDSHFQDSDFYSSEASIADQVDDAIAALRKERKVA